MGRVWFPTVCDKDPLLKVVCYCSLPINIGNFFYVGPADSGVRAGTQCLPTYLYLYEILQLLFCLFVFLLLYSSLRISLVKCLIPVNLTLRINSNVLLMMVNRVVWDDMKQCQIWKLQSWDLFCPAHLD